MLALFSRLALIMSSTSGGTTITVVDNGRTSETSTYKAAKRTRSKGLGYSDMVSNYEERRGLLSL